MSPGFEVANDSKKVRCIIYFAKDSCEPWINCSSATAHMGSGQHISSETEKRQQLGEMERDNERLMEAACEAKKLFGDSFIPVDTIPSIQVMENNSEAMLFQLQTDEEKEMTRRVLRHLNDPKKEDPNIHPICRQDCSDQL
jgi:hypothetical protein